MHMMLQAVRALVSPSISQKERSVCQRRMNQSGLLQQLCTILMATGIPADVLTECINTVAEVIRGHPDNQVHLLYNRFALFLLLTSCSVDGQKQFPTRIIPVKFSSTYCSSISSNKFRLSHSAGQMKPITVLSGDSLFTIQ